MERMRVWDIREKVIGVADHQTRFVGRKLGMEEDLRGLGHACVILVEEGFGFGFGEGAGVQEMALMEK